MAQPGNTDPMNTIESSASGSVVSAHVEQVVAEPELSEKDLTTNFYIVGGVINITMITAYFVWAYRAWKKADKRKGR